MQAFGFSGPVERAKSSTILSGPVWVAGAGLWLQVGPRSVRRTGWSRAECICLGDSWSATPGTFLVLCLSVLSQQ